MRPHAAAGEINRAKQCMVFIRYSSDPDGAVWLSVTRVQAKAIIAHARERGVEDISLEIRAGGRVYIGEEYEGEEMSLDEDAPSGGPA